MGITVVGKLTFSCFTSCHHPLPPPSLLLPLSSPSLTLPLPSPTLPLPLPPSPPLSLLSLSPPRPLPLTIFCFLVTCIFLLSPPLFASSLHLSLPHSFSPPSPSYPAQGLAGSSAIITATMKCLIKFFNLSESVSQLSLFTVIQL